MESGSAKDLLQGENGAFRFLKMVEETGTEQSRLLHQMAGATTKETDGR